MNPLLCLSGGACRDLISWKIFLSNVFWYISALVITRKLGWLWRVSRLSNPCCSAVKQWAVSWRLKNGWRVVGKFRVATAERYSELPPRLNTLLLLLQAQIYRQTCYHEVKSIGHTQRELAMTVCIPIKHTSYVCLWHSWFARTFVSKTGHWLSVSLGNQLKPWWCGNHWLWLCWSLALAAVLEVSFDCH